MNVKTVIGWGALAFVVWWIIESPTAAAHLIHNIGTFLQAAVAGLSNFFSSGGKKDAGEMPWWEALAVFAGTIAVIIILSWLILKLTDRRRSRKNAKKEKS